MNDMMKKIVGSTAMAIAFGTTVAVFIPVMTVAILTIGQLISLRKCKLH